VERRLNENPLIKTVNRYCDLKTERKCEKKCNLNRIQYQTVKLADYKGISKSLNKFSINLLENLDQG
jgi:hypothetical protein